MGESSDTETEEKPITVILESYEEDTEPTPTADSRQEKLESGKSDCSVSSDGRVDKADHTLAENSKTELPNLVESALTALNDSDPSPTSENDDQPSPDLQSLNNFYLQLYIKNPSLKDDILKMYELDKILEKKTLEYKRLCRNRRQSNKEEEDLPTFLKRKSIKRKVSKRNRLSTAMTVSQIGRKTSIVPVADRKIKSAATNQLEMPQPLSQDDDDDETTRNVEFTEEEKVRIENILENNASTVDCYSPNETDAKLLDDINNKLKIYSSSEKPDESKPCTKQAPTVRFSEILESASVPSTQKSEMQSWRHELEDKQLLQNIDKKLKNLQQPKPSMPEVLKETDVQNLVQESLKLLNETSKTDVIEPIKSTENDLEPSLDAQHSTLPSWTLSDETLQQLLNDSLNPN